MKCTSFWKVIITTCCRMYIHSHVPLLLEYSSKNKRTQLDVVYILQNDEEMFKTGIFEDKNEETDCSSKLVRYRKSKEEYSGYFWNYSNVTSRQMKCILFHGTMSNLEANLYPSFYRYVYLKEFENH